VHLDGTKTSDQECRQTRPNEPDPKKENNEAGEARCAKKLEGTTLLHARPLNAEVRPYRFMPELRHSDPYLSFTL
jgi:hypothetical protein